MESNHLNEPVYRFERKKKKTKKNYFKSDNKQKEEQKDNHEDVKKGHQNHKMLRRKVGKSRIFF